MVPVVILNKALVLLLVCCRFEIKTTCATFQLCQMCFTRLLTGKERTLARPEEEVLFTGPAVV